MHTSRVVLLKLAFFLTLCVFEYHSRNKEMEERTWGKEKKK